MQPKITEDEFLAWRDHPITKWVFEAIEKAAERQRDEWMRRSWEGGEADLFALTELRTRADAYMALIETPHGRWSELNEPAEA